MPRYEYKVVPAPTKGKKAKGVKGAEARFSHAIQELMNGLAGYGWEYQRAETLPSIERSGLTSTTTEWRNVLVFRRLRENDAEAFAPELLPAPEAAVITPVETPITEADVAASDTKVPDETPQTVAGEEVAEQPDTMPKEASVRQAKSTDTPGEPKETAEQADDPFDNGVEDTSNIQGVGATLSSLAEARKGSKTDA